MSKTKTHKNIIFINIKSKKIIINTQLLKKVTKIITIIFRERHREKNIFPYTHSHKNRKIYTHTKQKNQRHIQIQLHKEQ